MRYARVCSGIRAVQLQAVRFRRGGAGGRCLRASHTESGTPPNLLQNPLPDRLPVATLVAAGQPVTPAPSRRVCLSCGAEPEPGGALPCGH